MAGAAELSCGKTITIGHSDRTHHLADMTIKKLLALASTLSLTVCLAAPDFNQATEAELDSIKGIGPGTSRKILDERKKADFKDWHDFIARVPGIGPSKAKRFSNDGLTVNGLTYQAKPATTATRRTSSKPAASQPAAAAR